MLRAVSPWKGCCASKPFACKPPHRPSFEGLFVSSTGNKAQRSSRCLLANEPYTPPIVFCTPSLYARIFSKEYALLLSDFQKRAAKQPHKEIRARAMTPRHQDKHACALCQLQILREYVGLVIDLMLCAIGRSSGARAKNRACAIYKC